MQDELKKDPYFEEFINIPLIRAGRKLQLAFFREAVAPEGLSIQEFRTLLILSGLQDTHLRELARAGRFDPTHVSRTAAQLERKGLLSRADDPDDSRRKRIVITDAGRDMIARIWPRAKAFDARIQQALGATQFSALRQGLVAILALEDLEPGGDIGAYAAE